MLQAKLALVARRWARQAAHSSITFCTYMLVTRQVAKWVFVYTKPILSHIMFCLDGSREAVHQTIISDGLQALSLISNLLDIFLQRQGLRHGVEVVQTYRRANMLSAWTHGNGKRELRQRKSGLMPCRHCDTMRDKDSTLSTIETIFGYRCPANDKGQQSKARFAPRGSHGSRSAWPGCHALL